MKFKVGDKVLIATTSPEKRYYGEVALVLDEDVHAYLVKDGKGSTYEVHALNMHLVPDEDDKPTPLKMTLALEETLKEIIEHLNDNSLSLIENVVNHDYHEKENKHYI